MPQFRNYLKFAKQSLTKLVKGQKIHIVLGNESCDLDSMVSALSLAFYYYLIEKRDSIILPVINVTSKLFPIHVENVYILENEGINPEDLIFKDSLDWLKLQQEYKLTITLVDHHVLNIADQVLKPFVTEIIDHRPRDPIEVWDDNIDINIKLVGSCSTLIAQKITTCNLPVSLANLMYKTITYDTVGFDKGALKVTEDDLEIGTKLETGLNLNPENRKLLFEELWAVHNDTSTLTSLQLLYKDLKVVNVKEYNVFVPSLPMLVKQYLERPDSLKAIGMFAQENNAKYLVIVGLQTTDGFQRDIAVYPTNDNTMNMIEKSLLQSDLNLNHVLTYELIACYNQSNVKMSRKHIIPLIKGCL